MDTDQHQVCLSVHSIRETLPVLAHQVRGLRHSSEAVARRTTPPINHPMCHQLICRILVRSVREIRIPFIRGFGVLRTRMREDSVSQDRAVHWKATVVGLVLHSLDANSL